MQGSVVPVSFQDRRRDFASVLPHEVSLSIFSHLNLEGLETARRVAKQWNALASDDQLWTSVFHREFGPRVVSQVMHASALQARLSTKLSLVDHCSRKRCLLMHYAIKRAGKNWQELAIAMNCTSLMEGVLQSLPASSSALRQLHSVARCHRQTDILDQIAGKVLDRVALFREVYAGRSPGRSASCHDRNAALSPLERAALAHDWNAARFFLRQSGGNLSLTESQRLFVSAAHDGNQEIADQVLKSADDVEAFLCGSLQITSWSAPRAQDVITEALFRAARGGQLEMLRALGDRGAVLSDSLREALFVVAAMNGHVAVVRDFVEGAPDPASLVLLIVKGFGKGAAMPALWTAKDHRRDCARYLLAQFTQLVRDNRQLSEKAWNEHFAAAAILGDTETMELLLTRCLDRASLLRMTTPYQRETALMCAARAQQRASADLLLRRRVDPNARDKFGQTALHLAAKKKGGGDVLRLLLEKRADAHAVTNSGRSALMFATKAGDGKAIEILGRRSRSEDKARDFLKLVQSDNCTGRQIEGALKAGIALEALEEGLQHALERGSYPKARAIKVAIGNCSGGSLAWSLDDFREHQPLHILCKLLKAGEICVSEADNRGNTILHKLASHLSWAIGWPARWRQLLRALQTAIAQGAQKSARNDAGETALQSLRHAVSEQIAAWEQYYQWPNRKSMKCALADFKTVARLLAPSRYACNPIQELEDFVRERLRGGGPPVAGVAAPSESLSERPSDANVLAALMGEPVRPSEGRLAPTRLERAADVLDGSPSGEPGRTLSRKRTAGSQGSLRQAGHGKKQRRATE